MPNYLNFYYPNLRGLVGWEGGGAGGVKDGAEVWSVVRGAGGGFRMGRRVGEVWGEGRIINAGLRRAR